ncbi:hypothetical protein POPTR_004G095250v4 [Populus trichocarpa]|uniref:Uncharacterized protein n=1 Tax=Populus trichocarpa TaxID=3694 RepID=A0ACC0T3U9_POPTR|nr:hypothetical protein BDE02_04G082000 [Populus trichocarpa]KAI9396219.1 hypothetical protein POPTR_004G095250v4 [Populus trichocarpa]
MTIWLVFESILHIYCITSSHDMGTNPMYSQVSMQHFHVVFCS